MHRQLAPCALALFLCVLMVAPTQAAPRAKPSLAPLVCDVRAYGGVADDEKPDTGAIQAAIEACAGSGGQVVLVRGRWLSGGLELKSDMRFTLGPGAVLAAIPDIALYPERRDAAVNTDGGAPGDDAYNRYRAFLYAPNVRNVTIEGPGTLDGQGELFWDPNFYALKIPRPTRDRPQQMIEMVGCENVTVRDLTLTRAPAYSLRFYRCTGVRAENVTVRNDPRSPNTDGIQIRDTSNAFIRGADIDTGDDAIVVKSYDRMVENLIVTDSILVSDDAAIKFGTAGHVGVRNARFSDITIRNSRYGVALFQMDGGAYLDNHFSNISIETGGRATNFFAVYADIDRRRENSPLGRIEGLTFSGLDIRTAGTVLMAGQPEAPIRDLALRDITIRTPTIMQEIGPARRKPRGNAFVPPTGATEDFASVPATLVIANSAGVSVRNLDVAHGDPAQARSGLSFINVAGATVSGFALSNAAATGARPAMTMAKSRDVRIEGLRQLNNVTTFLEIGGGHNGALSVSGLAVFGLEKPIEAPAGVVVESDLKVPRRAR